jgi:hypothetical protein
VNWVIFGNATPNKQRAPGTAISYEVPPRLLAELAPTPEADETTGRSVATVEHVTDSEPVVKVRTSKPPKVAASPRERGNASGAYAAAYPAYSGDRPF